MTTAQITSRNVKRYLRAIARRNALRAALEEASVELANATAGLTGGQLAAAERILKTGENPYRYTIYAREPVIARDHDAACGQGCEEAVR